LCGNLYTGFSLVFADLCGPCADSEWQRILDEPPPVAAPPVVSELVM
jgi:hypothetical protein